MLAAASSGKKFFYHAGGYDVRAACSRKGISVFRKPAAGQFFKAAFFSAPAKTKKRRAQFSAWGKSGRSRQTEIALRGHAEWEFF
jgi:hypothetical protein